MKNDIFVEHVDVGYEKIKIVNDVSLRFNDGEITTIIGPNGCGKSTLLKAMTRIIPYRKGSIYLDGAAIAKYNTKELAKRLAILPQIAENPVGLTVGELVSYGRFPHQSGFAKLTNEDYEIIDWALDVTNTLDYKYREVDTLSGGQRQRVWIAMALAQKTDIIFLDEPTTYLDMAHQLEVLQLLKKLNEEQGRTVIMVLHDLNHAARFSHSLIALRDGELVKQGSVEEMMQRDVLATVFNIDATIVRDPKTDKPVCLSYELI
ncbi:ABC transporter ATP-binding protein [Kurthia huakuii]|uniref:ABC transporter ATP-binding protein n=1 Tax=Kurthia huakuii TaxID=1421019 RepID=UPI000497F0AC|nr:ABC transporter ATP-binding protein [Kurthia huakuii]MBM7700498.1 iron complex transport system ATP-binding protein [Kurthia huakuii]